MKYFVFIYVELIWCGLRSGSIDLSNNGNMSSGKEESQLCSLFFFCFQYRFNVNNKKKLHSLNDRASASNNSKFEYLASVRLKSINNKTNLTSSLSFFSLGVHYQNVNVRVCACVCVLAPV